MEYISEYLHQSVPVRKENLKRTGARVLTSDEAIWLVQERDQKKQKQLDLEKQKAERGHVKKNTHKNHRGKTKSKKTNSHQRKRSGRVPYLQNEMER